MNVSGEEQNKKEKKSGICVGKENKEDVDDIACEWRTNERIEERTEMCEEGEQRIEMKKKKKYV